MPDEEDDIPHVESESATGDSDDDPVPLFSPGVREEEETELLEKWATASEDEQIAQLTDRPEWSRKAIIGGAAVVAAAAIVFATTNLTGGGPSSQSRPNTEVKQQATFAAELAEQRRANRKVALLKRAKARQKQRRLAKQRARQRARQAQQEATSEPAVEIPVQTEEPSAPPPTPPTSPPVSPPPPAPDPAPAAPAPATPGQAVDAFGPGP